MHLFSSSSEHTLYIEHITMYYISAQTVLCILCTQNYCVQRTKPTKHEFYTKSKHQMNEAYETTTLLKLTHQTPGVRSNWSMLNVHVWKQSIRDS